MFWKRLENKIEKFLVRWCGYGHTDIEKEGEGFPSPKYTQPYFWNKKKRYVQHYFGLRFEKIPCLGYLEVFSEEDPIYAKKHNILERKYGIIYWKNLEIEEK